MKLLRSEYSVENGNPVVYLFCRENGKRKTIIDDSLVPYFYVSETEKDNLKGIRQDSKIYEAIDGTKLIKVYTTLPEDVPKLRDKYSCTFEADILFPIRYMLDKVDSIEPCNPKIAFIDLETDNSGRVPKPELAIEPIICATVFSDDIFTTFVYREDISVGQASDILADSLHEVRYFRSEKDLLESLVEFIATEEPDVITGWNSTRFDLPYLINRLKRLSIDYNKLSPMGSVYIRQKDNEIEDVVIKGVSTVDLYDVYRRFTQNMEESYQLDFIGKKVVGIGKTQSASNIKWMWKNKIEELIAYNSNDCLICVEVDKKLRLFDFLDELRRLCFCNLEDCLTTTRMADSYILRLFHNQKVFPTRIHHEKVEYEGAFVGSWAKGIYENVAVLDLKSLYPSLIVSFNLSPETITENNIYDNDIHINSIRVNQNQKGFLSEVIENLFQERAKYKSLLKKEKIDSENYKVYDSRQYALKTLLNALYGQTAYVGSRIYNAKVAELTTYLGREIIKWSKNFLENLGYQVCYVDTDSCFTQMGGDDTQQVEYVLELLNSSYNDFVKQFGIENHILEMEFDKVYRKAFFGQAKKRYAAHCIWKGGQQTDKLDVVGFEIKRSDSSQLSRKLQGQVFDMLLRQDKTKDEVMRYIGDEIDRLRKGNFTFTEIGIPKGISRELETYGKQSNAPEQTIVQSIPTRKGVPANVRGAIYTTKVLGHELTDKPKMLYISKMPESHPPTDVLCFDEDNQVPPGTEIDIEKMLEKLVKSKLESIFEALGWKLSDLAWHWKGHPKGKGEQLDLEI